MAAIVVADDDRAIRKIVRDRLTAAGHAVETAEDGSAALVLIEQAPPDLVLLDLQMPGLDGFAVLEALSKKADAPSRSSSPRTAASRRPSARSRPGPSTSSPSRSRRRTWSTSSTRRWRPIAFAAMWDSCAASSTADTA